MKTYYSHEQNITAELKKIQKATYVPSEFKNAVISKQNKHSSNPKDKTN